MIDKLNEALAESLGDAMDCLRVWEAWRVGTMRSDDFVPVNGDDDRMAEIRAAATGVLGPEIQKLVNTLELLMKVEAPNHQKGWIRKVNTRAEEVELAKVWAQAREAVQWGRHLLREIASNDEWVPWTGGECPFEGNIRIRVRFRDGGIVGTARPSSLTWSHIGIDGDIMFYAIQGYTR